MRVFLLLFLSLLGPTLVRGHIGSSTVITDGSAGAYKIRVVIRPPEVIPGRAAIDVRFLETPPPGTVVHILPVSAANGVKSAPTPDETTAVQGDPALRHGELWLMTTGAYSVHVDVSGPAGAGRLIVPFESVATRTLPMARGLGFFLGLAGALLLLSGVTLASSGVRQSVLPAGSPPGGGASRGSRWAAVFTLAVFCFLAVWIKRWWGYEDWVYRNKILYRPVPLQATAASVDGQSVLELSLPPRNADQPQPPLLLPDHGKLMHLFALREPQLDAFAHLHPQQTKPGVFQVAFPPLPPGTYRLFADITYEDGFAATLTNVLRLPGLPAPAAAKPVEVDPDDSWFLGNPPTGAVADVSIEPVDLKPLRAGEPALLSFRAVNAAREPLEITRYLGMTGHAAVRRDDGSVFAHLHPSGTISMAAQQFFEQQAGEAPAMDHGAHAMSGMGTGEEKLPTVVSFPFEFPSAGNYRVWVQIKVKGAVKTASFDFQVLGK